MINCDHTTRRCPSWACRQVLAERGVTSAPGRPQSMTARRVEAAWRMAPLPGRLASHGLRARGDLATAC